MSRSFKKNASVEHTENGWRAMKKADSRKMRKMIQNSELTHVTTGRYASYMWVHDAFKGYCIDIPKLLRK